MGVKQVPQHWVTTCDCCKKEVTSNFSSRPNGWVSIVVTQDALDFQGQPVADGSISLLLCGRCGSKVVTGMNNAVNEALKAAPPKAAEKPEERHRCKECGQYDCDPEGVGHYRG